LDPWRKQIDKVNSNKIATKHETLYPHSFGDNGWYNFQPEPFSAGAKEIYYVTMQDDDLRRVPGNAWFAYLHGENPNYPEEILNSDFTRVRDRVAGMRADETTPDTRLADDPLKFNPASVQSLTELMLGGLFPGRSGLILHCRLRYFDPVTRRAGIPDGVAALVEMITDDKVIVTLVNTDQVHERIVVVQAGGYAEHQFVSVTVDNIKVRVEAPYFTVKLAPGCGRPLTLQMERYVNQPTMTLPWDRDGN